MGSHAHHEAFRKLVDSSWPTEPAGGYKAYLEVSDSIDDNHAATVGDAIKSLLASHPCWHQIPPQRPFQLHKASPHHIEVMKRRQRLMQLQLKARKELLRSLHGQYDGCPEVQRRTAIEEKQIGLIDLQRKVRDDIWQTRSASLPKRGEYRRSRPSTDLVRLSDTLYERLQADKTDVKRRDHLKIMEEVVTMHGSLREKQSVRKKERAKLKKAIENYHRDKERAKLREQDKLRRDRLKALRDNDEEAYLRLIRDTKNDRISQLLNQTEEYLAQLGAKVLDERRRAQAFKTNAEIEAEEEANMRAIGADDDDTDVEEDENAAEQEEGGDMNESSGNSVSQYLKQKRQYYQFAHRVQEKITKQPPILVGGSLKPYQLEGLQWLVSLYNNGLNGILADEMGLGKTIQTIALISHIVSVKQNKGPFMVVVPLSTFPNWQLEFAKWAPELVMIPFRGTKDTLRHIERNQLSMYYNVILTTYEMVMRSTYLKRTSFQYIIVDEGHRLKNADCKLFRTLTSFRCRHRVLLTGTPLQNSLDELWALLNFLLPTIFSSSDTFSEWFNSPFSEQGGGSEGMEMREEEELLVINRLHQVLRPFVLRREKKDVEKQLPGKTEHLLRCDISAWQRVVYEGLQTRAMKQSFDPKTGKTKLSSLNNSMMELRKVCNHPFLVANEYEFTSSELVRSSGKFDLLDRMLPKLLRTKHKVLIFSQMTKLLDLLEDFLNDRYLDFVRLDGSTKPEDRADVVANFNDPDSEIGVFLLSTRAGGLGLNLQVADTVILYDSDWNPQQDLQAQDRAHRIGQQNEVRVFRFVTATVIEEGMIARANDRMSMHSKIIHAGKFNNKASDEDRQSLLTSLISERNDRSGIKKSIPTPEQLNRLICRSEDEFELFQEMDIESDKQREDEWKENGGQGKCPPRLMADDELPDWLTYIPEDDPETKQDETVLLGKRKRTEVIYDDGMSDTQFARMVDEDAFDVDAPLNAESLRRHSKAGRRRGRPRKRQEAEAHSNGRDESTDADQEEQTNVDKMRIILEAIVALEDDSGRSITADFEELPTRDELPHYYQVIKHPVELAEIRSKMESNGYRSPRVFMKDMRLLYKNCLQYNMEDSQLYIDALSIRDTFENLLTENFPDLAAEINLDDDI